VLQIVNFESRFYEGGCKFCLRTSTTKTDIPTKKLNSMVWVRERTIPTERPPLVDEVIANFLRIEGSTCQRDGSLRPYSRFSRQEHISLNITVFWDITLSKKWIYPCNRPWRPIGLWDVEAPTFFRKSAHRWLWGCHPYAMAGSPLPPRRFLVLISVRGWVGPRDIALLQGLN
jgi:hypothetical protein